MGNVVEDASLVDESLVIPGEVLTAPGTLAMSDDVDALFGALAKAQGGFCQPKRTHSNPFYSSRYADLGDVIEATHKGLSDNELCAFHGVSVDSEHEIVTVSTRLGHASGQWLELEITLPATMKAKDGTLRFDAQSIGSAITYGRRYGLSAILGIASEEDDDGSASKSEQKSASTQRQNKKDDKRQIIIDEIAEVMKHELIDDDERAEVRVLIPKAKTYKDLSVIRNSWTIKRDQRIAAKACMEEDLADGTLIQKAPNDTSVEPEQADIF